VNAPTISLIVFGCVFGGALLGLMLHTALPQHHLSADSRDVVKLGTGLVGTMAALVLGLLVASAKGSYDAQNTALTQLAANVALLDRVLAHYGPGANEARARLRGTVVQALTQMWPQEGGQHTDLAPSSTGGEVLFEQIEALVPKDDRQRSLHAEALRLAMVLGQTRWLMYEQGTTAVSLPLLVVLVVWLTIIFLSFGILASPNGTVLTSLCVSALSVSGAVFLILEMYAPYTGLIQISSAPLRAALARLGQ
jgi:hypothetical protein